MNGQAPYTQVRAVQEQALYPPQLRVLVPRECRPGLFGEQLAASLIVHWWRQYHGFSDLLELWRQLVDKSVRHTLFIYHNS